MSLIVGPLASRKLVKCTALPYHDKLCLKFSSPSLPPPSSLPPSHLQGSGKLIVNAKGSDSQLISNLLDEIKALV